MKVRSGFILLFMLFTLAWNACQKQEQQDSDLFQLKQPVKVFYDNDEASDVYTDEYLYALQQTGEIELLGVSTSTSIGPVNKYVREKGYWRMYYDRQAGIKAAGESGFINLPVTWKGPLGHIAKPPEGRIVDSKPLFSEAAVELIRLVNELPEDETLLILAGGPLTMMADAYLQDSAIADKILIGWVGGNMDDVPDYNAWADPWAAFICMSKYNMILVPFVLDECPDVTGDLIKEKLPESKLTDWMYNKNHHVLSGSQKGHDVDVPPIIAVLYPDYILNSFRASVSGWKKTGFEEWFYDVPAISEDPSGNLLYLKRRDGEKGTMHYWNDMQKAFEKIKQNKDNEQD
jgi:hypothetical protein